MTNLKDQVAIITGASSGIGAAAARELHAAGMKVVLTGRDQPRLEAVAKPLGADAVIHVADAVDPGLPDRLIALATERFGRCDVLFNNAGVMHVGTIKDIDLDAVCRMVRVNVEAVYRFAYTALRHFLQQGHGHLINTSSTLGLKVRPTTGAYAGTKFAVEALTEDLRMQCAGTGVRVGVIEPGLTDTGLQTHFPEHPAKVLGIRRMAEPADIARALRFMLEQPAHVTIPRLMLQPSEQPM